MTLIKKEYTKFLEKYKSERSTWNNMKTRCYYKSHNSYKYYGGKGVIVCDRWKNSFRNFVEDMGQKPTPTHSLERIDGSGNYELSNCRWATPLEQGNNTSRNIVITYNGETLTVAQWGRKHNIKPATILSRIYDGYLPEAAILPIKLWSLKKKDKPALRIRPSKWRDKAKEALKPYEK